MNESLLIVVVVANRPPPCPVRPVPASGPDVQLPLAVGATELTPWEHVFAYAAIASGGKVLPRHPGSVDAGIFIRRIEDARGMAELTNAIQKFFVENSRLKIPVIFHEECLHGHAAIDGTSFPQPIGLGAGRM